MTDDFDTRKAQAATWFRTLRDQIVAAFEGLEDTQAKGPTASLPAGRFEVSPTTRADGGGGLMSVMRGGRVFEKVGVNVVRGARPAGRTGAEGDGRARRAGHGRRSAVLGQRHQPCRAYAEPARARRPHEHADVLDPACLVVRRRVRPEPLPRIRRGHRAFPRHADSRPATLIRRTTTRASRPGRTNTSSCRTGAGRGAWAGIFYDDLNTGDWDADFAFTRDVGRAFLPAFVPLIERRRDTPWTEADREAQLIHRGLYAEYNLVYDRGTKFGLETGHDANAVLMSLPPVAKWT